MIFNNLFKGKEQKMVTEPDKFIQSEVSVIRPNFVMPKFNRLNCVNAYTGHFATAIDANVNQASNGIIRLYAKESKNGQKCFYKTKKIQNEIQKKYLKGILDYKPPYEVESKIMDTEDDFAIVMNHPVTDLLRSPNPLQSNYNFFKEIYLNLEISGDVFIFVVSNPDGTPAQLYVLKSQYVEIVPGGPNSKKIVEKYYYNRQKGSTVSFEEDEIIHIKYPNPNDFFYGMGKIEKGWQAYLLNKYSHEYQIALYKNNMVPSYVLINKGGSSESASRFKKMMKKMNFGPTRAGKVMGFDADVEIKEVAQKQKDLSDVEINIAEIASVTGCPINRLIPNDNIKANAQEQNTAWLRGTILTMMNTVSTGLSRNLLWRYNIFDKDAFLHYDSPVPQDVEEKRKSDETYLKTGVLSPDEVRVSLGKEPRGGKADELYYNGSSITIEPEEPQEPENNDNISEEDEKIFNEFNSIKSEISKITKEIKYFKDLSEKNISKKILIPEEKQPNIIINNYMDVEEE